MAHAQERCLGHGGYGGDDVVCTVRGMQGDAQAHGHGHGGAFDCTQGCCGVCACACAREGRARYVMRGKRVTEQHARAHAAEHGSVVHEVHELAGGGGGSSVSVHT
jgi:hypothetical protein